MQPDADPGDVILSIRDLAMRFPIRAGFLRRTIGHVHALTGIDLDIRRGETLGLVGESGSGKTTLGKTIVRLLEPSSGTMRFRGQDGTETDLAALTRAGVFPMRRRLQMVFQDPYGSFDPRMTIRRSLTEPLEIHGIGTAAERRARAAQGLRDVSIDPAALDRYPNAFSGGQRQRIGLARALLLEPEFLVCDEPVSALDVSVQAQVLALLDRLRAERALTLLFITHDLAVAAHVADRVAVMYLAQIVETGPVHDVFSAPRHPYSEALISAIPSGRPGRPANRVMLEGAIPSPAAPPPGCRFSTRCRFATDACRTEVPALRAIAPGRQVRCHHAETLGLSGAGAFARAAGAGWRQPHRRPVSGSKR
jgi:oligopeptide/dipeptide ABC transporter ATP-binding protein